MSLCNLYSICTIPESSITNSLHTRTSFLLGDGVYNKWEVLLIASSDLQTEERTVSPSNPPTPCTATEDLVTYYWS